MDEPEIFIVLDSNIAIELTRPVPDPIAVAWVRQQEGAYLYITSVTVAELLYGVELMSKGRRQDAERASVESFLDLAYGGRILPFDGSAARHYAEILAIKKKSGRPTAPHDSMIAAIARSLGMAVATRNVRDFAGVGVDVIDPWADGGPSISLRANGELT